MEDADYSYWDEKHSKEYVEGRAAHDNWFWYHEEYSENPYEKGTREYTDWEEGYMDALDSATAIIDYD